VSGLSEQRPHPLGPEQRVKDLQRDLAAAQARVGELEVERDEASDERDSFFDIVNRLHRQATDHTSDTYNPVLAERITALVSQAQKAAAAAAPSEEIQDADLLAHEPEVGSDPAPPSNDQPCPNCGEVCGDRGQGHLIGKPPAFGCDPAPRGGES
jgi:hypothetical protein